MSITQYHNLSKSELIYIFGLSLIAQFLGIFVMFLLALSIGLNLSFLDLGWIRSFIVIITMLPISFSGIGVREASLIVLLQPYSVSSSDAVALSFLL